MALLTMISTDPGSKSITINQDQGGQPEHAEYAARIEDGILTIINLRTTSRRYEAPFNEVVINGTTFGSPAQCIVALSEIGNFPNVEADAGCFDVCDYLTIGINNELEYKGSEIVNKSDISDFATSSEVTTQINDLNSSITLELADKADLVNGIVPNSQLPIISQRIRGTAQGYNSTTQTATGFNDENGNPITGNDNDTYYGTILNLEFVYNSNDGLYHALAGASIQLGETSSTAYRGDRGVIAYNHTQTTGNPHGLTKADLSLQNVDNTSDLNKPISNATQTALNGKENAIASGTLLQYWRGDKTWQNLPTYIVPVKSTQAQALAGTDDNTFITPLQLRNVLSTLISPVPNRSLQQALTSGTTYTASSDGVVVVSSYGLSLLGNYSYTINGVVRNWGSGILGTSTSSFSFVVKAGDTYWATFASGIFIPFYKFYAY